MDKITGVGAYYEKPSPYKEGIAILRELALQTGMEETLKWNFSVYTYNNKNVIGICRFKSYFGIWFYQGALLSDPKNVLRNAQEGKTVAIRQWKFHSVADIDTKTVLDYMLEAKQNQEQGMEIKPSRKKHGKVHSPLLTMILQEDAGLQNAFSKFSPYKQNEFMEYIANAKQQATKHRRLEKIQPMILEGVGLNDKYRS